MDPTLATFIISAGRASNVPAMAEHTRGLQPTWIVPQADAPAYRAAGAFRVQGQTRPGLSAARNAALSTAFRRNAWCVQLDDDLRSVQRAVDKKAAGLTLPEALRMIAESMAETGALHGSVAPTSNPYFSQRELTLRGFCIGSLTITAPCDLRYDTTLPLKEDWDYTCQHLEAYGQVARRDDVLATFRHYDNPGGVQRYRTDDLEQQVTDQLLARWPQYLAPHSRRPHELALKRMTVGAA